MALRGSYANLESLLPGAERELDVLPAVGRQHLVKAAESEKFSAIE